MCAYIKPVLQRRSSNRDANDIINNINISCKESEDLAPEVEISLSKLVDDDDVKAKQQVGKVKELLVDYYTATNLNFITHENITSNSLKRSRLHLNRSGLSI